MDYSDGAPKEIDTATEDMIDELIYYFVQKKRLKVKNYNYRPSAANKNYLLKSAKYCVKYHISPALLVQTVYDQLDGQAKENFNITHLQGEIAKKIIVDKVEDVETYTVELNNFNIDYQAMWDLQVSLVQGYMRPGETVEDVIKDSTVKLDSWFRILVTERPVPDVISNFKHIAQKELNPRLIAYIKDNGLDLSRITN